MPHEFVTSYDTLVNTTTVPSRDDFYSSLKNTTISEEEYSEFEKTWDLLQIKNLLQIYQVTFF